MRTPRVPLEVEPIDGAVAVAKYDRYAVLFMRPEYRLTVRKILKYGIHEGRVLDIGTGSGKLALELSRVKSCQFDIIGLDISAAMLKLAQSNTETGSGGRISYVQATAARLPFPDQSFDIVTSYASLHHWQQPVEAFDEIWRVTKKNGLILVRDNRRMLGNPFYKTAVRLFSIFLRPEEKGRWPKSILSSYTVDEVKQLLKQTRLRNCRVYRDMGGFDLCIEARKNSNSGN